MRYIKSLLIIFSLFTLTAYAQEEAREKFPKIGYVKNDETEIKAGDNVNFESLCTLSKSESVKIIDRRYSWFKVLLPKKAFLYVNKDYVNLTSDEKGIGIINAVNVNLRAGAGTRYAIVGQISKPEKVSILSEDMGWYKIEPPYGTTGWIYSNQISIIEEKEIKDLGQKETIKELNPLKSETFSNRVKEEKVKSPAIRLNATYPVPKGNLSISNSTKNNR